MSNNRALILIDFINEIVHPDGKLSGKGYASFINRNNTKGAVATTIDRFRSSGEMIIHVGMAFSDNYSELPTGSPLLGAAKRNGVLNSTGWGCKFADYTTPEPNEALVPKCRISAFYNTKLESILRPNSIQTVIIAGCATDLAVQSAVRDAHDRDYEVIVVEDACAAASDNDHEGSISVMRKFSTIKKSFEI